MDLLRAARGGRQEHLGGGIVRIFFQEMVFIGPDVVKAETIGGFHLRQRLLDQPVFGVRVPGARQL